MFNAEQGASQGCTLFPILFSVLINHLLKLTKTVDLGIQLISDKTVGRMFVF